MHSPHDALLPLPGAGPPNPLFDPCAWARVGAWFNRQDVQEAIHAIQVRRTTALQDHWHW